MTIDVLPDDVLVEIFLYVNITHWDNPWHALVHVCRRWRHIVFALPRRFDLQLKYTGRRPMSEVPDAWLVLPVILLPNQNHPKSDQRWDNRVAALESEYYNRICRIQIDDMTNSRWERFAAAMQKPFPELTNLEVQQVDYENRDKDLVPVLPDSFLGGSAPRLQRISFRSIPLPSIPKLLLSANGLVTLTLWDIPDSGYFSSDAMATSLTAMTRLESLHLQFHSPRSRPDPASRPLSPPTRFVLPALTTLIFEGVHEYLEVLLARIDAPLLSCLCITFFMDRNFDVPQLHRLIGQAEFKALDHHTIVVISDREIRLSLSPKTSMVDHSRLLELGIHCEELDQQLSSLTQVCSPSFPLISTLEELKIQEDGDLSPSHWKDDMEDAQWLELLEPFTGLKDLHLTDEIARRVSGALQEVPVEMATEVLPALRNIFVDEFWSHEDFEAITPFLVARRRSGYTVTVHHGRLT